MTYKIVKYCRLCKKRYIVPKGQSHRVYCEACHKRISQDPMEETK